MAARNMEWADFVRAKIAELGHQQGERMKNKDFAEMLGVESERVSFWLSGERVPTGDTLDRIADILGPGAYEAAGKSARLPADPAARLALDLLYLLSPEDRKRFIKLAEEAKQKSKNGQIIKLADLLISTQLQ